MTLLLIECGDWRRCCRQGPARAMPPRPAPGIVPRIVPGIVARIAHVEVFQGICCKDRRAERPSLLFKQMLLRIAPPIRSKDRSKNRSPFFSRGQWWRWGLSARHIHPGQSYGISNQSRDSMMRHPKSILRYFNHIFFCLLYVCI